MRLSTKSRYAVTAMLDLALSGSKRPVTLAEISDHQNISLSYLEQLFAAMRAKGLVRGVRGPGGGYYLGKAPEDISIADIVCAVDEWVDYTQQNIAQQNSAETHRYTTRMLWDDLSRQIFGFLASRSLRDLIQRDAVSDGALESAGVQSTDLDLKTVRAA